MTTNELGFYEQDIDEEVLSIEEQKKLEIEMARIISEKECSDKNINIGLITLKELERIGFKKDLPTYFLSRIIENLYHERNEFDSSDYFDLTKEDNEHYTELVEYYNVGDEQFYRAMAAVAIGNSNCEVKNINELAYRVVFNVSKAVNKKELKLA